MQSRLYDKSSDAYVAYTINPFMGTLKLHSNGSIYSNTVIATLAVDGWAITFGTARRGLGGLRPRPVPSPQYQNLVLRGWEW